MPISTSYKQLNITTNYKNGLVQIHKRPENNSLPSKSSGMVLYPKEKRMRAETNPFALSARPQERRPKAERVERLHSMEDLRAYLIDQKHPEGCVNAFFCDPWDYEPVLLDKLIHARAAEADQTEIDTLRGLIRAGTVMTSPRLKPSEVFERMERIRALEDADWSARIEQARRDPTTADDLARDHREQQAELAHVTSALRDGVSGEELESAVRIIEDLNAHTWKELGTLLAQHKTNLAAARESHLVKPIVHKLEILRSVRDTLYFRRLYPIAFQKAQPLPKKLR